MHMQTFRIGVNQQDIDHGTPGTAGDCAIAVAMRRLGFGSVSVGNGVITFEHEGRHVGGKWSRRAIRFIHKYDKPRHFGVIDPTLEPFVFELRVDMDRMFDISWVAKISAVAVPV